jgi:hypothetical protein
MSWRREPWEDGEEPDPQAVLLQQDRDRETAAINLLQSIGRADIRQLFSFKEHREWNIPKTHRPRP